MSLIVAIVGVLVGGSILAMLWLSGLALLRRFTRRRLESQADRLRKLLAESRASQYEGLDKLLFDMRDTFDPEVLDAQMQVELGKEKRKSDDRLIAAVRRLGLADRYVEAVRNARSWRARAGAAHALGALGETSAAIPLVEAMRDSREDRDVKLACAEALGRINDADVIPLLCEQLGNVDEWSSPRIAAILTGFGAQATEPLLGVLDHGESLNARVWAAQILGKSAARKAVPALRDRLHDRSEQMRLSAANALGEIGDVRAVRSLIDVSLRDPTPAVRAQAAQALGKLGDPEALPILVTALGDPEYWMRFRALEAIEQLKPDNIEMIELALGDTSPEVRRRAALALERLGLLDEAFSALASDDNAASIARERLTAVGRAGLSERFVRHLNDESPMIRRNTAEILGEVGDSNHAAELEARLKDDDADVRRAATRALGSLAVESTVPSLIALLYESDSELADSAVSALRRFPGRQLAPFAELLGEALGAESDRTRVRAATVLQDVPGDEVDDWLLVRGIGDRFVEVRLAAVHALGERHCEPAVEAIGGLLADPYEPLRVEAARALSAIGGSRAVDLLLARMARAGRSQREAICRGIAALGFDELGGALDILLGDGDVNARIGATWVLGNTGVAEAVPLLAALAIDSESRVRSSAAGALSKIPGGESFKVQRSCHDDPNQFVRAAVVNAIGARGSEADLEILEARIGDPDDYVRNRAVVAVGRIGGERVSELIGADAANVGPAYRVLALGLCGEAHAIGDALSALADEKLRGEVASLVVGESEEVSARFVENLGLAHAPDVLREAFASSLEPSPLIAQLVTDLRNHNLLEARLQALRSLARLNTKQATTGLTAAARHDPSPTIRVAAVAALAERISDPDVVKVLCGGLSDPDSAVRARSILALGSSGDPLHRPLILAELGSPRADVDGAARDAAIELFGADVDSFVDWLLGRTDVPQLCSGLAVLKEIATPAGAKVIGALSVSPHPEVRVAAVLALSALSDVESARALIERFADPDPAVRATAVIHAPSGEEMFVALRTASVDPTSDVRAACAARLADGDAYESIALLEQLCSDPNADVAATALGGLLHRRGLESRTAFVRASQSAECEAVARAYRDSAAAVSVIASEVRGALTVDARAIAVGVLSAMGVVELASEIAEGTSDPDPRVRLEAARGLAAIGVENLDDRLRKLIDDPVAEVRSEVRRLLIRSV